MADVQQFADIQAQHQAQQQAQQPPIANNQGAQPQAGSQTNSLPSPAQSPIDAVDALRKKFRKKHNTEYREGVEGLYKPIYQYLQGSVAEKQFWRNEAENAMNGAELRFKSGTSVLRMYIRLAMYWLDGSNAGKVETWAVDAFNKGIAPATIGAYYDQNSPQQLAANKSAAKNGTQKKQGSKPDLTEQIRKARIYLKSQSLFSTDAYTNQSSIKAVTETTVRAAVVTLNPDGKLVINGFVNSDDTLNALFAEYANENSQVNEPPTQGPSQPTQQQPKSELEAIQDNIAALI